MLAVGGRLDRIAGLDNFCWPDPVLSPSTPDGPYKLAQLVRANEALKDVCVAYGVPLISGKDSMKNDSTRGGRKISIPPSVLFSAIGKIDDVGRALTMEPKGLSDIVYLIGETRAELGGSEYAHMLDERAHGVSDQLSPAMAIGGDTPSLDTNKTIPLYKAVEAAVAAGEVRSLHAVGLGGLGASLALMGFGCEMGLAIQLGTAPVEGDLSDAELLFSESCGRLLATVSPERAADFEKRMAGLPHAAVGPHDGRASASRSRARGKDRCGCGPE